MKITGIDVHKVALPYVDGAYAWGAGNAIETATASVGPPVADGKLFVHDTPGLGTAPDFDSLGEPVATYGAGS